MKIKSYIDFENKRNDNEYYLIHLYKEGIWWSGYELSAYLCHMYKNKLKDKLKVNKKHLKKENIDFIKIGLQEKSFDKYLPNNHEYVMIVDNEHIIINAEPFIDFEINKDNYKILLNDFKSITPFNDNTINENKTIDVITEPKCNDINIMTIINEIYCYNTNNKTKEELELFINDIKEKLSITFLKMFS